MEFSTILATVSAFLKADHGPTLRRYATILGTVAALLITLATIAADAAYSLGRQTREAIDARNEQLAVAARTLIEWTDGIAIEFPDLVAPDLAALPVRELRRLARAAGLPRELSRSGRRADLLAALA